MRQAFLTAATAALLLAPLAPAASAAEASKAMTDQAFVDWAADANRRQIALAREVVDDVEDSKVRNFAERMISDHEEALRQLREAAGAQDLALSETAADAAAGRDAVAARERAAEQTERSPAEAYVDRMVESHDRLLTRYAEHAQAPETPVQVYAADQRPILRKHREIAEKIDKRQAGRTSGALPTE